MMGQPLSGVWNGVGAAIVTVFLMAFSYAALEYQDRYRRKRKNRLEVECLSLRTFADMSSKGFMLWDLDTRLIYANTAFCRMLGANHFDELKYYSLTDYCSEENARYVQHVVIPAILKNTHHELEISIQAGNQNTFVCRQSMSLIHGRKGTPVAIANTIQVLEMEMVSGDCRDRPIEIREERRHRGKKHTISR